MCISFHYELSKGDISWKNLNLWYTQRKWKLHELKMSHLMAHYICIDHLLYFTLLYYFILLSRIVNTTFTEGKWKVCFQETDLQFCIKIIMKETEYCNVLFAPTNIHIQWTVFAASAACADCSVLAARGSSMHLVYLLSPAYSKASVFWNYSQD